MPQHAASLRKRSESDAHVAGAVEIAGAIADQRALARERLDDLFRAVAEKEQYEIRGAGEKGNAQLGKSAL